MYNSIDELILEFLQFFTVPITILIINAIFRIIKDIAQVKWTEERKREKEVEKTQKMNIDEDLKKYFDYKE